MSIFGVFLSILIPLGLGFTIIEILFKRHPLPKLYSLALGYGLGLGILAQYMFILGIFNIPYTLRSTRLPLSLLVILLAIFNYKDSRNSHKHCPSFNLVGLKLDAICIFLILFISYQLLYAFWRGINIPVTGWDALSAVAFKSKIIYYESSLKNLANLPHAAYPLHVSLIQVWVALNNQIWNDSLIKIIFPITYLSLIIVVYYTLISFTNKRWALIGVGLLASSSLLTFHASVSYRDLFLTYYTCSCTMLLITWSKNLQNNAKAIDPSSGRENERLLLRSSVDRQYLILAALFAGFATFVKLEGVFYFAIHLVVLCFILNKLLTFNLKDKIKIFSLFAVPGLGITVILKMFQLFAQIPLEGKTRLDIGWYQLSRITQVLTRYYENLFGTANWGLVWVILGLSLLKTRKIRGSFQAQVLLVSLFLHFTLISSISMFTESFIWISGELSYTTLSRLILHFFPIAVLLIIIINAPPAGNLEKN